MKVANAIVSSGPDQVAAVKLSRCERCVSDQHPFSCDERGK